MYWLWEWIVSFVLSDADETESQSQAAQGTGVRDPVQDPAPIPVPVESMDRMAASAGGRVRGGTVLRVCTRNLDYLHLQVDYPDYPGSTPYPPYPSNRPIHPIHQAQLLGRSQQSRPRRQLHQFTTFVLSS
ncbi:hypothetical protein F4819DRAFT_321089 [Hypoxylon fuscum]|nr:hypothetical protein F4819DRAFT_321089 [Hypoxylon fuscum]